MPIMKLIRCICVSVCLACGWQAVYGCWGPTYSPKYYRMFRIADFGKDTTVFQTGVDVFRKTVNIYNCELWQRQTSLDIPLPDISHVVLGFSVEKIEEVGKCLEWGRGWGGVKNAFVEWIITHKDRDLVDLLILAKRCERVRLRLHNDPWYYEEEGDGWHLLLDSIHRVASERVRKSVRYGDRYLLQAMRALFSLGRYEECVTLWENESPRMAKSVIRNMTGSYAAGAYYRLKQQDRAVALYAECDDLEQVMWCLKEEFPQEPVLRMECIYWYYPQADELERLLQTQITELENAVEHIELEMGGGIVIDTIQYYRLKQFAMRVAREGKVISPATWMYGAAFIADILGDSAEAMRLMTEAKEMRCQGGLVKGSSRIFNFYLSAKTQRWGEEYKRIFLRELQWLDTRIVAQSVSVNLWNIKCNISFCYVHDMMRKVVLEVGVPRCVEEGEVELALLLANYADNRLLLLEGQRGKAEHPYGFEKLDGERYVWIKDWRDSSRYVNEFDFSNDYFALLDTMALEKVLSYRQVLNGTGGGELVCFLRERCYRNADYLNEIIGTRYLRNREYVRACEYFSKVPLDYQERMNVTPYLDRDGRFGFAVRMLRYQEEMQSEDAEVREEAMFRYALGRYEAGVENWALTRYEWNDELEGEEYARRALKELLNNVENEVFGFCVLSELSQIEIVDWGEIYPFYRRFTKTRAMGMLRGGCDNLGRWEGKRDK